VILSAWPFRRKDEGNGDEPQPAVGEESSAAEIDHMDWGIRLGMLERYERAAEQFRLAVKADPDDAAAGYNLALALDLAGRHKEASETYAQVLERSPDLLEAQVNLSLTLLDLSDTKGALDSLREALTKSPDDAIAHFNLGCVYLRQKMWINAAAEFQAAAKADPKDPQTRFNLAIAWRRAGNRADAERELRDFIVLARGRYPEQREYVEELLSTEYGDAGGEDGS